MAEALPAATPAVLTPLELAACSDAKPGLVHENGFRFVTPYFLSVEVFAKQGWVGRTLVDVLCRDFSASAANAVWAIQHPEGIVRVDGERTSPDTVLRGGQRVEVIVHRHELPVPVAELHAWRDGTEVIVVDKPAGWPCHPTGAWRINSVSWELSVRYGMPRAFLLYRLDRLVSGVLLLATTPDAARRYSALLSRADSYKIYVARVAGRCGGHDKPTVMEKTAASAAADAIEDAGIPAFTASGSSRVIRVCYPIVCLDARRGVYDSGPHIDLTHASAADGSTATGASVTDTPAAPSRISAAKSAETHVLPLLYDPTSDTSIVLCRPVTGRTHQLRLHLRAIGHAIANDPSYGPPCTETAARFAQAAACEGEKIPLTWAIDARLEAASVAAGCVQMKGRLSGEAVAELVARCPFCDRAKAGARHVMQAAGRSDDIDDDDTGTAASSDAPVVSESGECAGGDDGDDGVNNGALACLVSKPRPARIWLHALLYKLSPTATQEHPPHVFRVPLPPWLPEACSEVVAAAADAWLTSMSVGV